MKLRVEAERFAAILRDDTAPEWRTAFDDLRAAFAELVGRGRAWPRVRELGTADSRQDLAEQLANDFWIHLVENRRMLDPASVQGPGAVHRQLVRFLLERRSVSLDNAEANLRDHLATKLRDVLDEGDFVERRRNLWGLDHLPSRSASPEELARARAAQPRLQARWVSRNSLQNPPVAAPGDLDGHARAFLTLLNSCCWFDDLHESCWLALDPPFASMMTTLPVSAGGTPLFHAPRSESEPGQEQEAGAEDRYRDFSLDRALYELVDGLDRETRAIVRLTYGQDRSVRALESATGTPKSTIARRLEDFRNMLAEVLRKSGYDEADEDQLIAAFRDVFDS